ncbi:MAG: DUF4874 domain-containing protein, partial [Rikenellaceae bacterium]
MKIFFIITLALTIVSFLFFECSFSNRQTINFNGITADQTSGKDGLYNPDRGFRLEIATNVGKNCPKWNRSAGLTVDSYFEDQVKLYMSDSVSLVQTYFYITESIGKYISQTDLDVMTHFFALLRAHGQKAVLRFAYESDYEVSHMIGATLEDIARHTKQLKPLLEANKDVIHVVQAGMIGLWGEWHNSLHGLQNSDSIKKLTLEYICDMTPKDIAVQVRVPRYRDVLSADSPEYKRISYHDDFIVIKPHGYDGDMHEGTENFDRIVKDSYSMPIDGELPWGSWSIENIGGNTTESCWIVDGPSTARQLWLEHFTSLSVVHNYKESGEQKKYSMIYWKETPITEEFLLSNHMPISDSYFRNSNGDKVERNVFDYIRDHLGYRIELQSLDAPKSVSASSPDSIEIKLVNRGFATMFNDHKAYIVIADNQNNVICEIPTDANTNL